MFAAVLSRYDMIDNSHFKWRFGSSYADLETKNGKKVLIQPIYFFLRRLYLSYLVMFGSDTFVYQMAQLIGSTLIAGILPYMILSFRDKRERQMSNINEILTLFSCYVFTTFNIVSVDTNFKLGYFIIFVLGVYMVIVIFSIIYTSIKEIYRKLRIRAFRKAYLKKRANLQ